MATNNRLIRRSTPSRERPIHDLQAKLTARAIVHIAAMRLSGAA